MKKLAHWCRAGVVLATAMIGMAAGSGALAQDAPPKLGFVSLDRILRDSDPAKAAQAKLESEFAPRRKDLADTAARLKTMVDYLEKNSAVLGDTERARRQREFSDQDKEFQRRQREFNEDLNQRQNEEFAAVVEKANQALRRIASDEHFDLILQDDAAYVSPRVDITARVIEQLNHPPASANAPAAATPSAK